MKYYKEDVIEDLDQKIVKNKLFDEWFNVVKDILKNDEFQKRKLFFHHKKMTVWEHSILVSFKSFCMAKKVNADQRICAIAGLLHDFYPWTWIYNPDLEELDNGIYLDYLKTKKKFFKKHGFTHAKAASLNYVKYFPELENIKVTNSIERHMFPLNIIPPKYKEGVIITAVDKINSISEFSIFDLIKKKK